MRNYRQKVKSIPTKYYYQDKFDGGLNLFISSNHLEPNESPDLLNVEPTENGVIRTRYGYSKWGNSTGSRIRGMGRLVKDDGTRYCVCFDGGTSLKVRNFTTGDWDSVSGITYTADKQTEFCQAGNKLFIQNGTDDLTYFDGSVTATQTNGQKAKYLIYFNGSLVTAGDPDNPHRVYISATGADIGDFSAGAGGEFVDIAKSDGNFITGFGKYGTGTDNVLLIYKGKTTYKMTLDSSGLPTVETVSPTWGAICHRSIDNLDNDLIFLTDLPTVMIQGAQENYFDQIRTNELSLFVNPELETVNQARLDQVAGIYYNHRYYLAYSESGQTYNNKILMYDNRYNSWWKWDGINANCFLVYEDSDGEEHFLFGSDNSGQVYEFDLSRDDDGEPITSYYTTPAESFKKFDVSKYYPYFDVLLRNVSGTLTIEVYLDDETLTKTATIGSYNALVGFGACLLGDFMFGDDGSDDEIEQSDVSRPKRIMVRKKARTIKLKFSMEGTNDYFTLLNIAYSYKEKSPRRFDADDIIR